MQIRTSAGGASPGPARRQGAGRGRDWRSRAYRRPWSWAPGGGGRTRGGGPGGGGRRGGAGGGIREPGRGKLEGGSWTSQERCVGRGRIGVESMTGRGGSQQRPLAFRSAPRPAPSPLILTVHRPGTPAGGHQSVHRRSSCTELRHVETHGEPPAGGGIRAGGGIPAGSARARILRARRPTPPGFEDLGRRRTGE